MGRAIGTAGCAYLARLSIPSFPDHDTACRWSLAGAPPMRPDLTRHVPLSAADVMDLRVNARAHVHNANGYTHVLNYNATSNAYELRAGVTGPVITSHADVRVMAALLRGEAFEPGYVRKVLDPAYVADELGLDADAREMARRARAETEAQTRARAREAEDLARARRAVSTPLSDAPADLSVADLFRTL
jgi:hypothetical protein